jgi:hypothetical protein
MLLYSVIRFYSYILDIFLCNFVQIENRILKCILYVIFKQTSTNVFWRAIFWNLFKFYCLRFQIVQICVFNWWMAVSAKRIFQLDVIRINWFQFLRAHENVLVSILNLKSLNLIQAWFLIFYFLQIGVWIIFNDFFYCLSQIDFCLV